MTGLWHSPLHVTEFCGEMQGKFKVGLARLTSFHLHEKSREVCVNARSPPALLAVLKMVYSVL